MKGEAKLVQNPGPVYPADTLVRTKGGQSVHLYGCHYAGFGKQWLWAEGRTLAELRGVVDMMGYRTARSPR